MTSLYDVLGVKKDATEADIKLAKRKLARKHHPDRGGSTEQMALVNRAADVLEDATKRAHYDATGQESIPDKEDEAFKCFVEVLAQVLSNPDLKVYQVLGAAQQELEKREESAMAFRDQIKVAITKLENRLKKSRYKGKKTNMIEALTLQSLEGLRQRLAMLEEVVSSKVCRRAMKLLKDYEALDEESQAAMLNYYDMAQVAETFRSSFTSGR
jgi:curved DNA-binding protein CbpA